MKTLYRLRPTEIPKLLARDGKHNDGGSLYLQVRGGRGAWVFESRAGGRRRSYGLGTYPPVTLAQARKAREEKLRNGSAAPTSTSFGDAVEAFLGTHSSGWRGGVAGDEAQAYRRTLLGSDLARMPVTAIDTGAVERHLAPWNGRPTSEKVRTKIKSILDFAIAKGWRTGDNPAARSILKHLLPVVSKAVPHKAMPYVEVPAYMVELQAMDSTAARALAFTILTAARSGETAGARWSEIQGDIWVVSSSRMKQGEQHRVPLAPQALALLGERGADDDLVFAGLSRGVLGDLARIRGVTAHGFRSTFVEWAKAMDYPSDLREEALAHVLGNQTRRSYDRDDLLEKRRPMMLAWATFATAQCAASAASTAPATTSDGCVEAAKSNRSQHSPAPESTSGASTPATKRARHDHARGIPR